MISKNNAFYAINKYVFKEFYISMSYLANTLSIFQCLNPHIYQVF